ncbi:3-oxoacyl-[acyl-carrier-protein] reductase FabG [Allorhodopirellula solitaria]|uniref:3-oxoacyl-[acyl-carrier-protein] reductase FabG n=2 Tax=Allorhodopirellula solitaria TaxID=2527987 RepID=A0A5C5X0A1_9BACT|nr:3-oxoacyl-[acyl-carrier-protein] reductase FabG [Allorhodopirellula solitaria]
MAGIVVTGASSGIGRAIAIRLAADTVARPRPTPTRMLIHYRCNRAGAEATANEVRGMGVDCQIMAADLSKIPTAEKFAQNALDQMGPIDTWVNNAGADVLTGEPAAWSFHEKLRWLLDVDLCGTAAVSRIVGPAMAEQDRPEHGEPEPGEPEPGEQKQDEKERGEKEHSENAGEGAAATPSMVFIGWDQAAEGMEGDAGMMFGPVKAAVMAFAASLAQTLAPRVRVNTVAPGWIQTAWGESTSEYWNERATTQALMGRWGRPSDVAAAVAYLSRPEAGFVTGQTVNVNGGWNRKFA